MSRQPSHEDVNTTTDNIEALEVIREEQCSPALSSVHMDAVSKTVPEGSPPCTECACKEEIHMGEDMMDTKEIEKILLERETLLRNEFQQKLNDVTNDLKEKFDYILQ